MSDDLGRLNDALEGRYLLQRLLGAGGMASVYLADDVRHDRNVAVKVLRPELAAVLGGERFLAEIRTTANLQHPHILPLFDSGEADGFLYYVMPYVEGESLAERLAREKQLPVGEAVGIATRIASALDAAHRQGVIHRDIKPANILLAEGEPMVADFGIALAVQHAGSGRLTDTGLSVGTPFYMSPEQATGDRDPDARSDVYSLGCVLYEMLTGDPPHTASTSQAVVAKILTESAVPPSRRRPAVPAHVEAAVLTALETLPADRFTDVAAFAAALGDPGFSRASDAGASSPVRTRFGVGFLVAIVGVLGIAVGAWLGRGGSEVDRPVERYPLAFPAAGEFGSGRDGPPIVAPAVSPDGSRIAFRAGRGDEVRTRIYLLRRDELTPVEVPNTEAARSDPVFSPESDRLAFLDADRVLRIQPLSGGPATILEQVPGSFIGMDWADDGFIYVASLADPGMIRIPESGGSFEPVEARADSMTGVLPYRVPGSSVLLFSTGSLFSTLDVEEGRIWARDMADDTPARLLVDGRRVLHASDGMLVWADWSGRVFASSFDLDRLETEGPAVPILDGLNSRLPAGIVDAAVGADGTLLYVTGQPPSLRVDWVMMDGTIQPTSLEAPEIRGLRLAPDGRRVAFGSDRRIRVRDLDLGTVVDLGGGSDPFWNAGGDSIYFHRSTGGGFEFDGFRAAADGSGDAVRLFELPEVHAPHAWGPDGRLVARAQRTSRADLVLISFDESGATVEPYLEADWTESLTALSPDGRYVAYVSDESGEPRVLVRTYPDPTAGRWEVSLGVGTEPVWAPDGETLYYWSDDTLMAARLRIGEDFDILDRAPRFVDPAYVGNRLWANYDIHPDGDRFVMVRNTADGTDTEMILVRNFLRDVRDRIRPDGR